MRMKRANAFKHYSLMMALVLMLNALLPFAVSSANTETPVVKPVSQQVSAEQPFDGMVLICTSEGYKWVHFSANDAQSPSHQPSYDCGLCYLAAHDMAYAMPHFPATLWSDSGASFTLLHHDSANVEIRYTAHAFYTRAPPVFV